MTDPKIEIQRQLITAGLCDLIGYLDGLDAPIIVGGGYPRARLLKAFVAWCSDRKVSVADADADRWLAACEEGSLTQPGSNDPEPEDGEDWRGEADASTQ